MGGKASRRRGCPSRPGRPCHAGGAPVARASSPWRVRPRSAWTRDGGLRVSIAGTHGLEGRATREALPWHGLPARGACNLGRQVRAPHRSRPGPFPNPSSNVAPPISGRGGSVRIVDKPRPLWGFQLFEPAGETCDASPAEDLPNRDHGQSPDPEPAGVWGRPSVVRIEGCADGFRSPRLALAPTMNLSPSKSVDGCDDRLGPIQSVTSGRAGRPMRADRRDGGEIHVDERGRERRDDRRRPGQ